MFYKKKQSKTLIWISNDTVTVLLCDERKKTD